MRNFKQSILVLCLLVSVILSEAKHVHIRNDIGENIDLMVHCKSKNDDLGDHLLHPQETYEFAFTPNIFGTTLFFCGFTWAGQPKFFNIYDDRAHSSSCGDCYWAVHVDGPCLLKNDFGEIDTCYKWNSP
ncbi:S-protein homolog 3-like [Mercurialis annua]|uniref:S-protein homolog 3-like n=1 Tax=Mercurialis annua TaxID=3986 RepID=UPI00215F2615|nr:S-protein homolog 3-like [Mercurialis annua]